MAAKRLIPLALFALLIVIDNGHALPGSSRIWGGTEVSTGQYPYVASVRVNFAHACVGSIISQKHILTAGHCVSKIGTTSVDPSSVTVRVGSANQFAGGEIVETESIVINPTYGNFLNDVAIIILKKSLTLSDKVQTIALPKADAEYEEGTTVAVAGWGVQASGSSPYKLEHVTMSVLSSANCELQAGFGYDSVLCLAHPVNTGFCRGDDGAGVVSGNTLIGVASFAFGTCGTKYPDVSAKVSYYREWIDSVIA